MLLLPQIKMDNLFKSFAFNKERVFHLEIEICPESFKCTCTQKTEQPGSRWKGFCHQTVSFCCVWKLGVEPVPATIRGFSFSCSDNLEVIADGEVLGSQVWDNRVSVHVLAQGALSVREYFQLWSDVS